MTLSVAALVIPLSLPLNPSVSRTDLPLVNVFWSIPFVGPCGVISVFLLHIGYLGELPRILVSIFLGS